ncbi:hypothetical protein ACRALDRAFT_2053973 [Sodiomyces alcalophilus JCM 7366]|uniref:uncharacterized protein n=1 Tax=Sodiomyces alcalophilus JCM 7366 TaxID=591952 RepID=UPI0039B55EAF
MTDWSKLKVVELRAELKSRGLQCSGRKQELVERLHDDNSQTTDCGYEGQDYSVDHEPDATGPQLVERPQSPAKITNNASPEPNAPTTSLYSTQARLEIRLPASTKSQAIGSDCAKSAIVPTPEPSQSSEVLFDIQKRERRSTSPPPDPKRAKPEDASPIYATTSEPCARVEDSEVPSKEAAGFHEPTEPDVAEDKMDLPHHRDSLQGPENISCDSHQNRAAINVDASESAPNSNDSCFVDNNAEGNKRAVDSALHPTTRALYIKNFMRPLRPETVELHIKRLATPPNQGVGEKLIERFYLDQIRSHAFVVFFDSSNAARARAGLHGVIWPHESNRKPLWVDFIPPEKVSGWIDEEKNERHRGLRSGPAPRWEIRYNKDEDGNVIAVLDSGTAPPSITNPGPIRPEPHSVVPSGFPSSNANIIPLGPRGGAGELLSCPPVGPRNQRESRGNETRRAGPAGPIRTTRSGPRISYQAISDDLASRRVMCMRSHYTRDSDRDLGAEDEINRYTFESDAIFVDRGKEVFIGIRPPHRGANRQRQQPGGVPPDRGPPPHRVFPRRGTRGHSGSDRYLPGFDDRGPFWQGGRGTLHLSR